MDYCYSGCIGHVTKHTGQHLYNVIWKHWQQKYDISCLQHIWPNSTLMHTVGVFMFAFVSGFLCILLVSALVLKSIVVAAEWESQFNVIVNAGVLLRLSHLLPGGDVYFNVV